MLYVIRCNTSGGRRAGRASADRSGVELYSGCYFLSEGLFKLLRCYKCNSHSPPSYTHLAITLTLVNDALMSGYINLSMNIYEYMIQRNYLTVDFIFLECAGFPMIFGRYMHF